MRTTWTLARATPSKGFLGGQLPPADPPTMSDPTVIRRPAGAASSPGRDADTDDLVLGEFILAQPGGSEDHDDLNVPTRRSMPIHGAGDGYDELPGAAALVARAPSAGSVSETLVRPKVEAVAFVGGGQGEAHTVRVPAQPPRGALRRTTSSARRRMSRKVREAQAARLARNRTAAKSGLAGLAVVAAIAASIVAIGLWSLV